MKFFLRALLVVLLALNLGVGAWLLFAPSRVHAPPPAADPGVPELQLLADTRAPPPAPAGAPAPPAAETCTALGAFTTADGMRAALRALSPHVVRIRYRQKDVTHSHGFWVYLPATATREAVLDEARQLGAKGITDYYVVTAGDTQNTISLGMFNDPANAQKRVAQLKELGFSAQIRQRVDTEPAYWIDYAVPAGAAFDWKTWVPERADLAAQAIDCF